MGTRQISGIHHITAIASDPQRNLDFYAGVLGLRFVKRTVNFDDPGTYHFYFGDELGRPGTILTFFPWPGAKRGRQGTGFQTATAWLVPTGSIAAWRERLGAKGARNLADETRFGQRVLRFEDHDGMVLELVEDERAAALPAWGDGGIDAAMAIRGFHSATLTVRSAEATARLLQDHLGFQAAGAEGARTRFVAAQGPIGQIVDVVEAPDAPAGQLGAGVVHHLALRADDEAAQRGWSESLAAAGFQATPMRDRTYFRSIYFRERGGVLLEIATDGPGFTFDEAPSALGAGLKLPEMHEHLRPAIEERLEPIKVPAADEPALALHLHRFEAGASIAERTLLLLHGTGGNEHDLLPLGAALDSGANLLSPRGNVMEGSAARFFRRLREGVFDQDDLSRRTKELGTWLEAAARHYGFGPQGVVGVGFSNGANTAAAMVMRGLGLRRAVLLRPMVPFELERGTSLQGASVLIVSGTRDEIIPVEHGRRLARMLEAAGARVEHREIDAGHGLTPEDVELAHSWVAALG